MSWFNIFTLVKETNEKLIRIEHENATMKEKITDFSALFQFTVSKLEDRQNAMEKAHIQELAALKAEMTILQANFDSVRREAFMNAMDKFTKSNGDTNLLNSARLDANESVQ